MHPEELEVPQRPEPAIVRSGRCVSKPESEVAIMHSFDVSAVKTAYGLAFAVEDLAMLRNWAEQRRLRLTIALDRVIDGAEFEELLVVAPPAGRRALTLWRTRDGIYGQTPTGAPQAFAAMQDLLDQLRPVRAGWLQRLGNLAK